MNDNINSELYKTVTFKKNNNLLTGKIVNSFGRKYEKEKSSDTFIVKIKECMDPEDNPADVYVVIKRDDILSEE